MRRDKDYIVYKIEPGDKLSMIALKHYADSRMVKEIVAYNHLENRAIYPGMKIRLPMKGDE